jgi:hypothetical protein
VKEQSFFAIVKYIYLTSKMPYYTGGSFVDWHRISTSLNINTLEEATRSRSPWPYSWPAGVVVLFRVTI